MKLKLSLFQPNKFLVITLLATFISFLACKKDSKTNTVPETPVTPTGGGLVVLVFHPKVDTATLIFNKKYVNKNTDTFTVSKFNYFTSNINLFRSDNSSFTESNSYHLVRHSSGADYTYSLSNVPAATYTSMCLTIGFDSTRNVSGVQSGDLDPANSSDMYWSWNSGYIFMKLEGSAPSSGASNKQYEFHIGGFTGLNKTQRLVVLNFGNIPTIVKEGGTSIIHIKVDVNEIFSNPNKIDFKTQYNILNSGANAKMVADNYADIMSLDKIQNN